MAQFLPLQSLNIPLANIIPAATLTSLRTFVTANNPALLRALAAPLNSLQSFNLNLPIVYQQGFGTPSVDSYTYRYALYGQDTWKLRPNFTLTFGLRYSTAPCLPLTGINNIVGSLSPDQRRALTSTRARGNRAAAPTEPLGFTSAANPGSCSLASVSISNRPASYDHIF